MNPVATLRSLAWQKRTAIALERIADTLEEQLRRATPASGVSFRSAYFDRSTEEGSMLTQTDEDLANLETEEKEAAAAGYPGEDEE